jgi:hypothetical protein
MGHIMKAPKVQRSNQKYCKLAKGAVSVCYTLIAYWEKSVS